VSATFFTVDSFSAFVTVGWAVGRAARL